MPYHFAIKVLEGKRGLKLTRENYAVEATKIHCLVFQWIFTLMMKVENIWMNGAKSN
ncbi:hypothetical protein [Dethiobacter alkaliphilus]|uniref:Uncharacterized protein n=1 Tax=Dethiobacter alkaliphilus AHT 1 TaxID=555088 RepID=C0GE67_DETAL|nr:hypothetical protein [Dethiobacter alkaliphilus]EEG78361.1 hypothetical protein DealDRAFT_0776 [Dethiobacter alkaliphilus AHT 1]